MTYLSILLNEKKSQTVSPQRQIEVSATESQREQELLNLTTIALNYKRIDKVNTSVAKTLCARDYKGFGTGFDTMNGVIEWKQEK